VVKIFLPIATRDLTGSVRCFKRLRLELRVMTHALLVCYALAMQSEQCQLGDVEAECAKLLLASRRAPVEQIAAGLVRITSSCEMHYRTCLGCARVMDEIASRYTQQRNHSMAARYLSSGLEIKERQYEAADQTLTEIELVESFRMLITSLMLEQNFNQAASVLRRGLSLALPPYMQGQLLMLESMVLRCLNRPMQALQSLRKVNETLPTNDPSQQRTRRLFALDMLRQANRTVEVEAATAAFVSNGPWQRSDQLPRDFVPGLTAKPWHRVKDWPHLGPVSDK
jgi:hypothetical protein